MLGLLTLALAACSTQTPVVDTSLQSFRVISYSKRDTCETQREIAVHNSVYETLRTKKLTTYRAPCDVDPPKPAPAAVSVPGKGQVDADKAKRTG